MAEEQRTCPKCFHLAGEKDKYCIKCGSPLINRCTKGSSPNHRGCEAENSAEAAFCAKCGSPTVFGELGLAGGDL